VYNRLPEDQRAMVYDSARARIEADLATSPLGSGGAKAENLFPEPPNMEAYRARLAERESKRAAQDKERKEGSMDRKR
jgi:hypothetical protein